MTDTPDRSRCRPAELSDADIIYDWNTVDERGRLFEQEILLLDETLRDGLQSPSITEPGIGDKIAIVHLLDELGVEYVNVGLPGAGPRAYEQAVELVRTIRDAKLTILPVCAARTHLDDIRPIVEISQQLGVAIECSTFTGSSPIRMYAEDWDIDILVKRSLEAIGFAVRHGLPTTYVTEDTTRSHPDVLSILFRTAIEHGATRLCLCDTTGHATPEGIKRLVGWTRAFTRSLGANVGIDWHGHNDRGLAVWNAICALEAGVDRAHGTVLGIGERVGNASLDQLLVNLKLLGELRDRDLSLLAVLCHTTAAACHLHVPPNYPIVGSDAFRTASGVHAAAIMKAERKGHAFLADRIYSSVPAAMLGREQEIAIGNMSGESNVVYWLRKQQIEPEPALVDRILAAAKRADRILTTEDLYRLVDATRVANQ